MHVGSDILRHSSEVKHRFETEETGEKHMKNRTDINFRQSDVLMGTFISSVVP